MAKKKCYSLLGDAYGQPWAGEIPSLPMTPEILELDQFIEDSTVDTPHLERYTPNLTSRLEPFEQGSRLAAMSSPICAEAQSKPHGESCCLLSLPRELRDQIWRLVFSETVHLRRWETRLAQETVPLRRWEIRHVPRYIPTLGQNVIVSHQSSATYLQSGYDPMLFQRIKHAICDGPRQIQERRSEAEQDVDYGAHKQLSLCMCVKDYQQHTCCIGCEHAMISHRERMDYNKSLSKQITKLYLVNKQLYTECIVWLYSEPVFHISSQRLLNQWLSTIPLLSIEALRNVRLRYQCIRGEIGMGWNRMLELMECMKGLRRLELVVMVVHGHDPSVPNVREAMESLDLVFAGRQRPFTGIIYGSLEPMWAQRHYQSPCLKELKALYEGEPVGFGRRWELGVSV